MLRTGDVGHRDIDGYFYITDRKKDMLLVNGINVYPREIEEFLLEQPEVAEVAVTGQPDLVKGEVPVAFVVGNATCDLADLERRCRLAFASFKVPKEFVLVDALPRNALGKVQKHLLPKRSA